MSNKRNVKEERNVEIYINESALINNLLKTLICLQVTRLLFLLIKKETVLKIQKQLLSCYLHKHNLLKISNSALLTHLPPITM